MSLELKTTKQFEKDILKMQKRNKNIQKLLGVMNTLIKENPLGKKYRNHPLIGNYRNRMECHIEPDWLLIYKLDSDVIIFERTGTHSDLF